VAGSSMARSFPREPPLKLSPGGPLLLQSHFESFEPQGPDRDVVPLIARGHGSDVALSGLFSLEIYLRPVHKIERLIPLCVVFGGYGSRFLLTAGSARPSFTLPPPSTLLTHERWLMLVSGPN